jgi:hypothetical protein
VLRWMPRRFASLDLREEACREARWEAEDTECLLGVKLRLVLECEEPDWCCSNGGRLGQE